MSQKQKNGPLANRCSSHRAYGQTAFCTTWEAVFHFRERALPKNNCRKKVGIAPDGYLCFERKLSLMRKNYLLTTLFVSFGFLWGQAQTQIPNSNFELWQNVGANNEEPTNWNGLKSATGGLAGFTQQNLYRSTTVRPGSSGQYSARIYSRNIAGTLANGNLTTGRVNAADFAAAGANNYNFTNTADANFNAPIADWPDSLVFWAKYTSANSTSTARIRAVLHDNYNYRDPSTSDANSPSHVVADATLNYLSDGSVWKRISVPFNYTGPATTPSHMLVTFTSNSSPGGGSANDEVLIDDMSLIYNPITTTPTLSTLTYNVSTTQGASISIPFTKTGIFHFGNTFTAQLSDASGSFASPVNLGTLTSTAAGTITGTIPAGTPSGSGYRVRVIASSPYQTANPNASNITINLVNAAIAPTATQTIAAGAGGTALSVTETPTGDSRVWKYATISGGPYTAFTPGQTGTSYTPNFATAGTYYVVCESTFGSLSARSNEVQVNVVGNQIAPAGTQSILVSSPGTQLSVTETPAGTAREWKYSGTPGGPYLSFGPAQTGTTYTPLFASAGTYYIVCQSTISGIDVTSNEVTISVGSTNLNTGTITGSPFEFSASAPDAAVTVPYTVSNPFNAGNTFTAQLSDANGSFSAPTVIGSVTATTDGSISASIPANTPAGTGYLIRVVSSNPVVLGSDNGTALTVDQFNNSVSPVAAQTFVYTNTGTALTVAESQNASSREWRMGTVAGGPYSAITPAQTGTSYTPSVDAPGTYYVVCASTNQYGDEVLSNEVMLTAENANSISTSPVAGSPFYVSVSANNALNVDFTSAVAFDNGNVFTAQLSNGSGSFSSPVTIGTLTSQTPGTISAVIPNVIQDGSGYRIRVVSSSPAIEGSDNGSDLSIINFNVTATPGDTQHVDVGETTNTVTLQSTHPGVSVEWKVRTSVIAEFLPFSPAKTGNTFTHVFNLANTYQVVGEAVNTWGDTIQSDLIVYFVSDVEPNSIGENEANHSVNVFLNNGQWAVDLGESDFVNPRFELVNMAGQTVYTQNLKGKTVHTLPLTLAAGVYTYRMSENGKTAMGKIAIH